MIESYIANSSFVPTETQVTPPNDPRWKWISVGSFKDRLGSDAMAIAVSSHDVCRAAIETLNGREYVDLANEGLIGLLALMVATEQPTANALFPNSGPMTEEKVKAILETPTTESERHVKNL